MPSPGVAGARRASLTTMEPDKSRTKLGTVSGVYIPVYLNILSILMFLRFGLILGQAGIVGMLGLIVTAYCVDLLTALSLSAIASNGEVRGGGAYFLISRSLGPEFGGSIGILFYLAQVLNTAMNVVGLIDCIRLHFVQVFPHDYWTLYGLQTAVLVLCTGLCFLGSSTFSKASNGLLIVLTVSILSIPVSAAFKSPFYDASHGVEFTGLSLTTLAGNFLPHQSRHVNRGINAFRELFGILFPATSGIFAGASMSGDLRAPSKAIPKGTLWAMLTTFIVYVLVALSMAASTTRESLLNNSNILSMTNLSETVILAGECSVTLFSALMGIIGSAKLFQALARDKLLPGLYIFGKGTSKADEPIVAICLTYCLAQLSLFADLDQIATMIAMGFQMTFFVMNVACFLLKIGSAPNFRPSFKYFTWQTAGLGALLSAAAMFFIDETYAAIAIVILIFLFVLIHFLSPPKHWGDVSQNLIYHQVRKYLLRLKPEHIKFWRPQIILLINDPRRQTRLIQFCNSLKKGSLYILGHVIVTDDFDTGVEEARLQQQAWTNYITESSRIKAFVQLAISPSINWGIRNLILTAGLGGMRPNIAVMGFYNMSELRNSKSKIWVPDIPTSPSAKMKRPPKPESKSSKRPRADTSARILEGILPTDNIKTESMMSPTQYMTALEDLALKYRLNVAIGYGFDKLETPHRSGINSKRYIDLWPIQMSAEVSSDGMNFLTTNFDTYTLILQLGHILHSIRTWARAYTLRVMVFVEYESEVNEESARVRALLEKLRIDAEIHVFSLASGRLNTYELIINGRAVDMDWEIIVFEALRDEAWWDELQMFRGRPDDLSTSQQLEHIMHVLDSTVGRVGGFNPHGEGGSSRRRRSTIDLAEVRRRQAVSILGRIGANVGMHTHHLDDEVLQDFGETDSVLGSEDSDIDEDVDDGSNQSFRTGVFKPTQGERRPLLALENRKQPAGSPGRRDTEGHRSYEKQTSVEPSYGTIAGSQGMLERKNLGAASVQPQIPAITQQGPSPSQDGLVNVQPSGESALIVRPSVSRQVSNARSSNRPVHQAAITTEGEESRITFLPKPSLFDVTQPERPTYSRQSSLGKFSSRPLPETQVNIDDNEPRSIRFADTPTHPRSAALTRQNSEHSNIPPSDVKLGIPELLDAYRQLGAGEDGGQSGSPYSTQGLPLSFNDLPSRAQHLILNELMRQNSADSAVLLTTLPIPSEGTSADEDATIQYLCDAEVLCNELPPTLMVLSNNMTVTVSL